MSSRITLGQYRALPKARKPNKYKAKKTPRCLSCGSAAVYGGACSACGASAVHVFDSRAEAARYDELRLQEKAGAIRDLRCQPEFPIVIEGRQVGKYVGDFAYVAGGALVVEDVKGMDTPLSRFKRKCVEAQYGIQVEVVRR